MMSTTPANPCPRTVIAVELNALDTALGALEGEIDGERAEAATLLVRAARELVCDPDEPLDSDAVSLLRVAAACVSPPGSESLETSDLAAGLTLIAKRATALAGQGELPHDARLDHVRATLAVITAAGRGEGTARDSSRLADTAPIDEP